MEVSLSTVDRSSLRTVVASAKSKSPSGMTSTDSPAKFRRDRLIGTSAAQGQGGKGVGFSSPVGAGSRGHAVDRCIDPGAGVLYEFKVEASPRCGHLGCR